VHLDAAGVEPYLDSDAALGDREHQVPVIGTDPSVFRKISPLPADLRQRCLAASLPLQGLSTGRMTCGGLITEDTRAGGTSWEGRAFLPLSSSQARRPQRSQME
jgi:hypothetical protein